MSTRQTTLRDVLGVEPYGVGGAAEVQAGARRGQALHKLTRELIDEAAEAWDQVADHSVSGDDVSAAYERGRAHTLCRVLGDQEALLRIINR